MIGMIQSQLLFCEIMMVYGLFGFIFPFAVDQIINHGVSQISDSLFILFWGVLMSGIYIFKFLENGPGIRKLLYRSFGFITFPFVVDQIVNYGLRQISDSLIILFWGIFSSGICITYVNMFPGYVLPRKLLRYIAKLQNFSSLFKEEDDEKKYEEKDEEKD